MENVKTKKHVFDAILNVFAWLSFFVAVIVSVTVLLSTFSTTENGKSLFGYKMLIVASDSMKRSTLSKQEPIYFDAGDIVIIKATKDGREYKAGDVISFISYNKDSYGKTLTHKIRKVNYSATGTVISYTTYGINTGVNDSAVVVPDTVIGKYAGKFPKLGNLFAYLKTQRGYYTSILIPSVFAIIFFSIKIGKYLGRKSALLEQTENKKLNQ